MTLFFGQINLVLLALVVPSRAARPLQGQGHRNRAGGGDQAHAVDLDSVPAVHAASKGRGGQRADLRGHRRTWVRAAAARLRGLLGREVARPGSRSFHLDDQSLHGVILRLTHAGPDAHGLPVAAVVVGIAGFATAILASRRGHERLGLVACAATGLLVSPITWSHHYVYAIPALSSPRTGHGASATGSSASRWWWACLAGGPCLSATRAAMTLRPRRRRAGCCFSRRPAAPSDRQSSSLAWAGLDRRQLLRAHPARVYRGHRMRPGAYPSPQARARAVGPRARCRVGGTPARRRPVGRSAS